jgi:hypothetical protein
LPAPPGRALKDLAGQDDREVLGIARLLPRASERRAAVCDLLVTALLHQGRAAGASRDPGPGYGEEKMMNRTRT